MTYKDSAASSRVGSQDTGEPVSFSQPSRTGNRGVLVTNDQNRICFTDSSVCDLLHIEPSALMGKNIADAVALLKHNFIDPDGFERRSRELVLHPNETAEDVIELAEGGRVLHRYSTPLLDAESNPMGRVEVYSDITRRRELESANLMLYQEVRDAYDKLRTAQEQLIQSEKLRAIGEIASGVAHDFNNTLGIILGNIQLLLRATEDQRTRSRLEAAEQAALDGAETVRRIREFARTQSDQPLNPFNLSYLAAGLVEAMSPGWEDRRINVELDLGEGVAALGTESEIREVLTNVLLNSVQAMPNGGVITVSTARRDFALLKVEDTGSGMTEDVRLRVFDPFFSTKGGGTGLGMSLAYGIVKRHGGSINIESRPGLGTTVTILLPASDSVEIEKPVFPDPPEASPVAILVVDDEEMFSTVFMEMLAEHGHAVCVARDGQEAIRRFKESPFDLVFTDLGMPGMSGWQVAKAIKEIRPTTPVVLLTGCGTNLDGVDITQGSVDMVLPKPVRMEELSMIITQAIGGARE